MTRTDDRIKDAFTTKCPYEADEGETFLINMREVIDRNSPGSFKEYAFYNKWDNKVLNRRVCSPRSCTSSGNRSLFFAGLNP